jgi:DNA replication protein
MMRDLVSIHHEVPVDGVFFTTILPHIRDLGELKVILHVMHEAARRGRPAVPVDALTSAAVVRSVAGEGSPRPGEHRLLEALERAVADGALLRLHEPPAETDRSYVLLATDRNRAIVDSLQAGDGGAERILGVEPGLEVERPNVFALYEQHVGPLTPLVAEQLRDAERSYPRGWIEEAIMSAVHYNKRTWRYIETILTRWEETGIPDGISGRRP